MEASPIYTDKALNNQLWHRSCARILVVHTHAGIVYVKCTKRKEAIRIFQKRFHGCKGYIIRMKPNEYRPPSLAKR